MHGLCQMLLSYAVHRLPACSSVIDMYAPLPSFDTNHVSKLSMNTTKGKSETMSSI